ncbi:MAG TPA: glycosyltransferase [Candidatus Parabacteroides faecavium]|nr:glycosyltransferase [Candidatus Parabacteroides faecavium]
MMDRNKSLCSITTVDITMEPFIISQVEYMLEKGWDVTIICNMKPTFIERIPKGVKYYNVPMERSFNVLTAIKCTIELIKIFRKEKYTIVQYAATHAALYSSFASWLTGIPIRMHLQWGIYNYSEMGLCGYFYKFIEWLTCRFSTVVRPVSYKNLQIAINEGLFKPGKGKVLGQGGTVGVDLKEYPLSEKEIFRSEVRSRYGLLSTDYVLGFVGRISISKGNNELIEAFQQLCKTFKNAKLLLVGEDEGSVDRNLMKWAIESDKVVVTNRISHSDIPRYMAAIDCLIHPTYREGFGMVLQEAMAMAVPVITTDIPGPSEVIEDGKSGVLIRPKSTQSVYDAMKRAVTHPKEFSKYGINGRTRVETCFARSVMLERIYQDKEDLYNKFCKSKV